MALPDWVTGVITNITDETPNTRRFYFTIPALDKFNFAPGQFVTLDLPIHEQKNKRWRSYSIASPPDGTNRFELVIVLLDGGQGTHWLWQHARVGSEITLRGPQGKFVLPEHIETDLYLICTGTGIAPFRSMVRHIFQHETPHKNIYLIFGCRKFSDTLYGSELRELQDSLEDFYYLPTYSRENPDNHLLMRTGYVHSIYEDLILRNRKINREAGIETDRPAKFYLCGWKNMIDDARKRLAELGIEKRDIHFELYG